jgi:imidazolonepropionase-like amidohydrolase
MRENWRAVIGNRHRAFAGLKAAAVCAVIAIALMLCAGAVMAQAPGNPPPYYAIKGAKIVPVSGPVIDGGTVVIANGLIAAVGKDVAIPPEAWVIDGKGLTVYPGLIDALTDVGMAQAPAAPGGGGPGGGPPGGGQQAQLQQAAQQRPSQGPEDRPGTTPWRTAADEVSPNERRVEQWRNAGFTSVMSLPRQGVFPGRGSVVNLGGERAGSMVVKRFAALGITMQAPGGFTGFPGSLMGVISYVKQLFLDAAQAREAEAIYEANPRGLQRPAYDRATYILNSVLRAGQPVLLPASNPSQIARMLDLGAQINATQKEKAKWILYGATQGYEAADILAAAKVPVLISIRWPERDANADPDAEETLETLRLRDKAPSTPAALEKAGVRFAFYSDNIANPRDMLRNAKRAIDAGWKADSALRAFTLSAAEILGVANQLGSIDAGKIANLVVTEGDIFGERVNIKMVFVDGKKYDVREQPAPAAGQGAPRSGGQPGGGATANMTGRWRLVTQTDQGPVESTADMIQAPDGTLTGTLTTMFGTATITRGSVAGNRYTYSFMLDVGQGPMELTASGTVDGNALRGSVSVGGSSFETTGTKQGPGATEIEQGVGR